MPLFLHALSIAWITLWGGVTLPFVIKRKSSIKQSIDGDILSQVMALPKHLQNQKLEVIVFPVSESEGNTTDISKRFGLNEGKFTVPEDFDRIINNLGRCHLDTTGNRNINRWTNGREKRVEYKKGWNPASTIHTIYAFENDYSNVNGGYWKFSLKITVDLCIL